MTTPATVKQTNAFSDLIVISGFITPVPNDLYSLRISEIQSLSNALIAKNLTPTGTFATQYFEVMDITAFGSLEAAYNSLVSWTNRYFQTPNLFDGINAQQIILALIGTAKGVDDLLNAYGFVPNYAAIGFVQPISGPTGTKFNATWFEDLLGSIYGTLKPTYNNIHTNQISAQSLSQYTAFISTIATVITEINALPVATTTAEADAIVNVVVSYQIVDVGGTKIGTDLTGLLNTLQVYTTTITMPGPVDHFISAVGSANQTYDQLLATINAQLGGAGTATLGALLPANPPFSGNINISNSTLITEPFTFPLFGSLTSFAGIISGLATVPSFITTYLALDAAAPTQIASLSSDSAIISGQINREFWWWYPEVEYTGDPASSFSRFTRIVLITTAAGLGLSINAFKNSTLLSTAITRVGSPNVVLAKDEVIVG